MVTSVKPLNESQMKRFFLGSVKYHWAQLGVVLTMLMLPLASMAHHMGEAACQQVTLIRNGTEQNTIANTLLREIYTKIGYQVSEKIVDSSFEAYELLKEGKADAYLSTWAPLDKPELQLFGLNGDVKTLHANLTGAYTGLATNRYGRIWGLERLSQLQQFADILDDTIYVGQADWRFAQILQSLIDNNVYELGQFVVQRVHNYDLNKYLQAAEAEQKPMVFFTRSPSFQAQRYASRFLADTRKYFKGYHASSGVYTTVRYDLPRVCPNVTNLLKRFEMTAAMQNQIIKQMPSTHAPMEKIVAEWSKERIPLILQWLTGVKTRRGDSAKHLIMTQWQKMKSSTASSSTADSLKH